MDRTGPESLELGDVDRTVRSAGWYDVAIGLVGLLTGSTFLFTARFVNGLASEIGAEATVPWLLFWLSSVLIGAAGVVGLVLGAVFLWGTIVSTLKSILGRV